MKIIRLLLLATLVALCSCSGDGDIQYLPFQTGEDSNWGMISTDGKVLFEEEFKNEPTVVMHDRFFVRNADGNWELYSADQKPKQIGNVVYDQAGAFIEDVAPVVAKGQPIQFINKNGDVKFSLGNVDGQQITECTNFSEGVAIFKAGKYYGCIDKNGKVIVKPEYIHINPASDGKIVAVSKKYENSDNDKAPITVLTTSGKIISEISTKPYDFVASQFYDGALVVEQKIDDEERQGLIDEKGEFILRPSSKIHSIGDIEDGKFIFYDGDDYGLMDFNGEIIIRPKYKRLYFAGKGKLLWAIDDNDDDNNYKLIDEEENSISNSEYEDVLSFYGSSAAVQASKNSWIFIDDKCNDKKIKENIYNIDDSQLGDQVFYSQYVDVDALVKTLNLQKTGFLGLTLNMNANGILKAFSALTEDGMSMDPNSYDGDYSIQTSFELSRVDINLTANFDDNIVSPIESMTTDDYGYTYSEITGYQFKNITPNQINLEIPRCELMKGRMSKATTALIKRIKELGSVYKENKNAAIVKVGNMAYFIANTGQAIEIVFGNLDINNIDISVYEDVTEDSNIQTAAPAVDADTLAVDSAY